MKEIDVYKRQTVISVILSSATVTCTVILPSKPMASAV